MIVVRRVKPREQILLDEKNLPAHRIRIVVVETLSYAIHINGKYGEMHVRYAVLLSEGAIHDRGSAKRFLPWPDNVETFLHAQSVSFLNVKVEKFEVSEKHDIDATEDAESVTVTIKVMPRAKREGFVGVQDRALKIALTAPPVDGAANEALIAFLSRAFRVTKRQVIILRGETARIKTVRLVGVSRLELDRVVSADL